MRSALLLFAQGFGIMMAKFRRFLRREIFFLGSMQVFFHLLYDMFGLMKVLNIKIGWCPGYFLGVAAQRAEFPPLEPVHVRECPAGRAPDNKVHTNHVISAIVIKTYRQPKITGSFSGITHHIAENIEGKSGAWCETKSLYRLLVS
jgi:hypothetical protein